MLLFSKYVSDDPSILNAIRENMFVPTSLQSSGKSGISIGDIVMSHWQIDRYIGKGSISTVYEAHHTRNQYRSAIKVIHSSFQFFDLDRSEHTHRVYDASEMIQMELDNI